MLPQRTARMMEVLTRPFVNMCTDGTAIFIAFSGPHGQIRAVAAYPELSDSIEFLAANSEKGSLGMAGKDM